MRHFWNWVCNDDESRSLYLDGVIAEESWFSDDITPAMFKEELFAGNGPITIHLNSPGGDCIAASQIYTMLMDYPGDVTIQIDGMAASAASVIAMAGTHVTMSPTSLMMIHNPFTMAMGDTEEMRKASFINPILWIFIEHIGERCRIRYLLLQGQLLSHSLPFFLG